MKKRIILITIIGLFLVMLPLMASAEPSIIDSGTCGENLTWTLDDQGVLSISGTGEMYDYNWNSPWKMYSDNITCIHVSNSVTNIGDFAFHNCSNLTSITLPNNITRIGNYSFVSCSSLTSITIPNNVLSIGNGVFDSCSNLTSVSIPEGITSIGYSSFYKCIKLKSIDIPSSVTSIGTEGVTSIGNSAFSGCNNLVNITIPEGVTIIDEYTFFGCSNLTNITIPKSVTSIGNYSFGSCSSLTSIIIPEGVTSIGACAFSYCTHILNIIIPSSVTTIGNYAFEVCGSLTSITIPEGVSSIGSYAFLYCGSLSNILIPDSVHTFGNNLFSSKPTVYCYEYSDADIWASDAGYTVVYLDNLDMNSIRTVVLPDDFRMPNGNTIPLGANVFPLSDKPSYNWNSDNPSIVSVNDGNISAHSAGTAKITLTVGNASDSVYITVYQIANSYQIVPSEIWIVSKDTVQLSLTDIEPENAELNVTWNTSDSSYATVDSTGFVTTKKPSDESIIISADSENGIHRECMLHICYPVTNIEFEQGEATVFPGLDSKVKANVTMHTQSCVNHLVGFSSSNPEIATVDDNGIVHGIAAGTTTITATAASGVTASMTINVREPSELLLPTGLTEIDNEAFMGIACEVVIIPDGCTTIGEKAFAGCTNLLYVKIPSSVKSYPTSAFEGCNENLVIDWEQE